MKFYETNKNKKCKYYLKDGELTDIFQHLYHIVAVLS